MGCDDNSKQRADDVTTTNFAINLNFNYCIFCKHEAAARSVFSSINIVVELTPILLLELLLSLCYNYHYHRHILESDVRTAYQNDVKQYSYSELSSSSL